MKTQQYFAGVLLIALLVAGALFTAGAQISALLTPAPAAEVAVNGAVSLAPSGGSFSIDYGISGEVALVWAGAGTLTDNLTAPTPAELAELPDLGTHALALLLQKGSGANVTGYVELESSLVFTGHHTVDTTVAGAATALVVGPQVNGTYANGAINLLSERVPYVTDSGEAVERQFRLVGNAGPTPGVIIGEYRETIWGYGLEPLTVVGTFELDDVAITQAAVNRPPVVESLALATLRNTAVAATLNAGDMEGQPITYVIVKQPGNGALSGTAPNLIYTPNTGFTGTDNFTFKVNDGALDSETTSVTIKVAAPAIVNSAPTANAQSITTVRGQAVAVTLSGTDANGDAITFVVVSQPTNGALSGTAPNLTYTPNANFVGADGFTFKVNDGKVDSTTKSVTISVTAPSNTNVAPTANAQSITTVRGQAIAVTLSGTDANGDAITFVVVSQPANGALSGTAPNLTYTPNANFVGADGFTFKVNDGKVDSTTKSVTISVTAPSGGNNAPAATAQVTATVQGQAVAIRLSGTDADGDTISYIIVVPPANGVLSGTAPNLTYTPNPSFTGTDSFSYKVNDGQVDSPAVSVSIVVNDTVQGQDEKEIFLPMIRR